MFPANSLSHTLFFPSFFSEATVFESEGNVVVRAIHVHTRPGHFC
jgi:hypothetical protein